MSGSLALRFRAWAATRFTLEVKVMQDASLLRLAVQINVLAGVEIVGGERVRRVEGALVEGDEPAAV